MLDLTKIPAEAWIDSSGRVRRFEFDFSISAAGQSLKFVSETQFSDFGEPVNVVAPASSDTVPFAKVPNFFSALVGAAAGGLSG